MAPSIDLDTGHGAEVTRRVLGNLPIYRSQAAWKEIQAEKEKLDLPPYPQALTLDELVARYREDALFIQTNPLDADDITEELEDLEAVGYVAQGGGKWHMTSDGLKALNAEVGA